MLCVLSREIGGSLIFHTPDDPVIELLPNKGAPSRRRIILWEFHSAC